MLDFHIQKKLGSFWLDSEVHTEAKRIGILGASGCGKSMTLRCLAGIERPDDGYIRLAERTVYSAKERVCVAPQKRRVGYLFQHYALFPTMTVEQNIAAGLHGTKQENAVRVKKMIETFQLAGLEKKLPGQLSGGQQQRTALARIMAYEPEVILLDEPFSALDAFLKDRLQQELMEMLKSYEGTVILVSHSRDEIYRFSEELLVMADGHIICQGKTKEVFANPGCKEAARLTGCKNITQCIRRNNHGLEVPAWGTELILQQEIPEDISYVGIRAHDFIPVWEEKRNNCIQIYPGTEAELPFEKKYFLHTTGTDEEELCWFVQREQLKETEEKGLPAYLQIPEEKLLLLRE